MSVEINENKHSKDASIRAGLKSSKSSVNVIENNLKIFATNKIIWHSSER